MNHQSQLKLQIYTPFGIVYNDFVKLISLKVHDGYRGVNKNQTPMIEKILMSKIKIFTTDLTNPQIYLIGDGLMQIDPDQCNIFTPFLINPDDLENNIYFKSQQHLKTLLEENQEKEIILQKELLLKKEIAKLKK